MSIIEQIKTEIEKLYNSEVPAHDSQCDYGDGYFTALSRIDEFLDTLESEKPVPNNLEDAARKYQEGVPVDTTIHYCGADEDVYFANRIVDAFIAGYNLYNKQMMKGAVEMEAGLLTKHLPMLLVTKPMEMKDFPAKLGQAIRVIILPK